VLQLFEFLRADSNSQALMNFLPFGFGTPKPAHTRARTSPKGRHPSPQFLNFCAPIQIRKRLRFFCLLVLAPPNLLTPARAQVERRPLTSIFEFLRADSNSQALTIFLPFDFGTPKPAHTHAHTGDAMADTTLSKENAKMLRALVDKAGDFDSPEGIVQCLLATQMTLDILVRYDNEETFKKDLTSSSPNAPNLSMGVAVALWRALAPKSVTINPR
jgi:hypothetical protein